MIALHLLFYYILATRQSCGNQSFQKPGVVSAVSGIESQV